MPYIKRADRRRIDNGAEVRTPGEFAYHLTVLGLDILGASGNRDFAQRARATGIMLVLPIPRDTTCSPGTYEGARALAIHEFIRRIGMDGYEDKKRKENGDLPGFGGRGGGE